MDFTKTIILLALMASELIAIDSEPIRARGIIVKEFMYLNVLDFLASQCGSVVVRESDKNTKGPDSIREARV